MKSEILESTKGPLKAIRAHGPLALLILLFLVAATVFTLRGPVRFLKGGSGWNDVTQAYVPARAWATGRNPYDAQTFVDIWEHQTGESYIHLNSQWVRATYPLTTLVVMSPLALLPWKSALLAWTVIRILLLPVMIWSLARIGRLGRRGTLTFATMVLALAPLHTGMATGNITIFAVELAGIAMWAAAEQRNKLAGILFGIVLCLKPQIGLCFLAYYLIRRHYRLSLIAAACTCLAILIGFWRLHGITATWVHDFLQNAQAFTTAENVTNDFSTANGIRFTLINLQVPLYDLTGSAGWANAIALAIGLVIGVTWLRLMLSRRGDGPALLEAGALAVGSLVVVYHRFYDATLLVLPLCWSLTESARSQNRIRWLVWLGYTPFLVPGAVVLGQLGARHFIPKSLANSLWWRALVVPHEVWALTGLAFLLLFAMREWRGSTALQGHPVSPAAVGGQE